MYPNVHSHDIVKPKHAVVKPTGSHDPSAQLGLLFKVPKSVQCVAIYVPVQDVVQLGYSSLVGVSLIRISNLILNREVNPFSELCSHSWQTLEHLTRMLLVISIWSS